MAKQYVENTTAQTIFVGGKMIPPGEGREIEVPQVHVWAPAPAAAPSASELLLQLVGQAISHIKPELPKLTDAQLGELEQLESAGQKRSTLIAAIQAERLERANRKLAIDEATTVLEAARAKLAALPGDASADAVAAAQKDVDEAQAALDELQPADEA